MQILQARRRESPACIGYPAGEPPTPAQRAAPVRHPSIPASSVPASPAPKLHPTTRGHYDRVQPAPRGVPRPVRSYRPAPSEWQAQGRRRTRRRGESHAGGEEREERGGGPGGGDGADMRVGVACPSAAGTCGRGAPWASADTGMECSTAPLAWELSNPGRSGRGPGTTHHGVGSQSACRVWSWEEGAVSCSPNGMLPASSSEGPGDTNPRHEPQYSLKARRVRSISPLPSHENPGPESRSPPHDSPSSRPGNLPENPITAPPTRRNPAKRADSSKLTGRGSASRWRQGCVRSEKWRGVAVHSSRLGPKAGPVRGLGVTENRNHAAKRNLHRSRRECALKVPGKKKKKNGACCTCGRSWVLESPFRPPVIIAKGLEAGKEWGRRRSGREAAGLSGKGS